MSGNGGAVEVRGGLTSAGAVATVALITGLALGWRSVAMLSDWRATAAQLRLDTWLDPSPARSAAIVVSAFGVVAAVLLLHPRTRVLGGWLAAGGLLALAVYLIAIWLFGDPVGCLCTLSARRGDSFTHGESIVLALAASGIAGGIALASRVTNAPHEGEATDA